MPDLSFNFGVVGDEVVIGALRQIGESAVDAAAAAVNAFGGALINTLKEMVSSTAAVETQQASLVALLNSTGMAAGMTQAKVNDLAMQFRDLAGGSAEAVVGIEEIALRAGTISANQMPEFIKVVADLGTVMGNTTMAATILARAQDDPVGAFTRLERITSVYDLAVKENIKTLVKHGETAEATAAIMDFVARATGGSAAAAADTLSGKWSILTGHFETFLSTIGGPFVAAMENLLNIANPTLDGVYKKFEDTFMPLITDMAAWGQALVEVFAEGMQSAFGLVVDVINQLGSIIASLMAPGSPPKFLPLLDVWGRQAVDVYLAGWTTFDKSVFDEIGKAIKAGLDAQLIHDYANTMHQLADANTAVSEAQDALNALTARYDGMITPLSDKLKALQNQDQIMADQKTLAGLQNILGDANASAAEKAQARRQIEEIHLKEQIAGLDLEKNTAVNSAKEKINVAQQHQKELAEQAKLLTTQIDIQAELNSSIHQGTAAVAGLHGALKAIPPTLASLGGAAGDMKNKITASMEQLKTDIQTKAGEIKAAIEGKFAELKNDIAGLFAPGGIFAPISTALSTVKKWWDDHHTEVIAAIRKFYDDATLYIIGHFAYLRDVVVKPALETIKTYWEQHHTDIQTNITTSWETFQTTISGKLADLSTTIHTGLDGIKGWWDQHGQSVTTILKANWATFQSVASLGAFLVKFVVERNLNELKAFWEIWGGLVKVVWDGFWRGIGDIVDIAADVLGGKWNKLWDDLKKTAKDTVDNITGFVNALIDSIGKAIQRIGDLFSAQHSKVNPGDGRADGGPVVGGSTYWVGERGPELFTAPTSGTIIPNHSLSQGGAPGGPTLNFNIDARGSQMSEHDFKRVIEKTLSEAGYRSDHLSRMGFS